MILKPLPIFHLSSFGCKISHLPCFYLFVTSINSSSSSQFELLTHSPLQTCLSRLRKAANLFKTSSRCVNLCVRVTEVVQAYVLSRTECVFVCTAINNLFTRSHNESDLMQRSLCSLLFFLSLSFCLFC